MSDYKDPIGTGGIWIKQGKKSKFLSIAGTLAYNGHQVQINGIAFKNENKTSEKSPDYNIKWTDAKPSESKNVNIPKKNEDQEDIPF